MTNEVTENFAYLPFGGGQRKCVGDQFALFESIITLAMVCRRFDVDLDPAFHPDGECGMTTGATIHTTGGLHVKLKRRAGANGAEMGFDETVSSLDELEDVNTRGGTPEAASAAFDEKELQEAKDVKEAAVVVGAATVGASGVKSGSGGAKGESPSIEGERFDQAVAEAEDILAKEEAARVEAQKAR
jgi:beta-ring hydroxylase